MGIATALAQHEPERLEKTFAQKSAPTEEYDMDKKWWR